MPLNRTEVKTDLNLGVVKTPELKFITAENSKRFKELDKYDQHFAGTQYDKLRDWDDCREHDGTYVPIRKRKPLVHFNLPRLLVERAASKLVGQRCFPKVKLEEDEQTEQLIEIIVKQSKLKAKALDGAQHFLKSGSVFISFRLVQGIFQVKVWNPKHCNPTFDEETEQLLGVRIQYKYKDEEESVRQKREIFRWFRLDITNKAEILYDNPEVKNNEEPDFKVVKSVQHNFGFVPGEWIANGEVMDSVDGESILKDILDIGNCLNYQLSQSDQAITYTQEPQLAFKGMEEEEVNAMIRSSVKAWNLGREGEAQFIEIDGAGIDKAKEHAKILSQKAQDLSKVVIMDPERVEGIYQSGEAMKVLHAPLVDLIHEVRPWFGDFGLVPLIQKMVAVAIQFREQVAISFPQGFTLKSLNIDLQWKPVFEPTLDDIQKAVGLATQAATANIITRVTATKFVSEFFGITDPEKEQAEVIKQPLPPSPFGPFEI